MTACFSSRIALESTCRLTGSLSTIRIVQHSSSGSTAGQYSASSTAAAVSQPVISIYSRLERAVRSFRTGRVKRKTVPCPGADCTSILPPFSSTSFWVMLRPRPLSRYSFWAAAPSGS
ncbi:hypothetical protein D3C75_1097470 [compost metagenome]